MNIIFFCPTPQGHGNFKGEKEQAEFTARFLELTKDLDLELVIWTLLHDWEGGGPFETMGLIDNNGGKKPVWNMWKELKELPLKI